MGLINITVKLNQTSNERRTETKSIRLVGHDIYSHLLVSLPSDINKFDNLFKVSHRISPWLIFMIALTPNLWS
jgi:hypothetical protein